jgi:hypothetical protein
MGRRGSKRRLAVEDEYRRLIGSGLGTVEAWRRVGIGRHTGYRWRAERGGMQPAYASRRSSTLCPSISASAWSQSVCRTLQTDCASPSKAWSWCAGLPSNKHMEYSGSEGIQRCSQQSEPASPVRNERRNRRPAGQGSQPGLSWNDQHAVWTTNVSGNGEVGTDDAA